MTSNTTINTNTMLGRAMAAHEINNPTSTLLAIGSGLIWEDLLSPKARSKASEVAKRHASTVNGQGGYSYVMGARLQYASQGSEWAIYWDING